MYSRAYQALLDRSMTPKAQERSIVYLAEHLGKFLKKREQVLICFQKHEKGNLSWLMEQAVLRCGAVPVIWGPDLRWKTLLRLAFSNRCSTVIGPPMVLLGLTKLKKANQTPLFVRKVITAGYPCFDWMIEGIRRGFDCEVGGCYSVGMTGIVAGFACGRSWGVHLREDTYGVDIVDASGGILTDGEVGEIVLYPNGEPDLRYPTGESGCIVRNACECGSTAVRLMEIGHGRNVDAELLELGQILNSWTSILDCRLERGPCGLEMEIVVFPGEKLPKLPTVAKQVIRPWDPERDEPLWYVPNLKNPGNYEENH